MNERGGKGALSGAKRKESGVNLRLPLTLLFVLRRMRKLNRALIWNRSLYSFTLQEML